MNFILSQFFAYSILLAALIGLVRFKFINPVYYPFILLLWIGLVNEIISTVIISYGASNAINSNVYTLVEAILLLALFRNWGLFDRQPKMFTWFLLLFIATWIADNFFISSITRFTSYFRILYSFTIVILSINKINRIMTDEKPWVERRAELLLVIGFIFFFTYQTLVEIFWVYGLNASRVFRLQVYRIMIYMNLSVNLIYAIGLLWIPRKRESLLQ